jgi:hypothetical protein
VFAAHGGFRLHVRATLLRAHGQTVLVDTGVGGPSSPAMSWYPAAGRLLGALAESGTSPAEIEVVDSDRVLAPSHFAEPFGRVVSERPTGAIRWVPIV